MPLVVSAAGAGVWGKSTKKITAPGSLIIPMHSICEGGCSQAQFL